MGSLRSSLIFNSVVALGLTPAIAKVVEILTKGDADTLRPIIKIIKDNDMIFISGVLFFISYFVAFLGNISASLNKCQKAPKTKALIHSIKVPFFVIIGFYLGILIPVFQEPWINLLSGVIEKNMGLVNILPYMVAGFMAMCFSWSGTALSYFSYMATACVDTTDDLIHKMNNENHDDNDESLNH